MAPFCGETYRSSQGGDYQACRGSGRAHAAVSGTAPCGAPLIEIAEPERPG